MKTEYALEELDESFIISSAKNFRQIFRKTKQYWRRSKIQKCNKKKIDETNRLESELENKQELCMHEKFESGEILSSLYFKK